MTYHNRNLVLVVAIIILVGWSWIGPVRNSPPGSARGGGVISDGVNWSALEQKLIAAGVVDPAKLNGQPLTHLNLLWAFGLANKNEILEKGPMSDPKYGGASGFASTGGWTLARPKDGLAQGNAMEHYSKHQFLTLTADQQKLVEKTAKNIYRPCCGNSTYFPDCNHGMAMLGLLEILASQGATEEQMYQKALAANQEWFPSHYQLVADYLALTGKKISALSPAELLSAKYSDGQAAQTMTAQVKPKSSGGASCGV